MPVYDLLDDLAVAMASYVTSFGIKAGSLEPANGSVRQTCTALWLAFLQKHTLKKNSGDHERAGAFRAVVKATETRAATSRPEG